MKNFSSHHKRSGQMLGVVIVLILILGGAAWWLYSHKQSMDKEGRAFGREALNRILLNYDSTFLANSLSPEAKLQMPQSEQNALMNQLRLLGPPAQPFKVDENMTWQSNFFEPSGSFTAHLNYPGGPATFEIDINHPVSRWQIINIAAQLPSMAR